MASLLSFGPISFTWAPSHGNLSVIDILVKYSADRRVVTLTLLPQNSFRNSCICSASHTNQSANAARETMRQVLPTLMRLAPLQTVLALD